MRNPDPLDPAPPSEAGVMARQTLPGLITGIEHLKMDRAAMIRFAQAQLTPRPRILERHFHNWIATTGSPQLAGRVLADILVRQAAEVEAAAAAFTASEPDFSAFLGLAEDAFMDICRHGQSRTLSFGGCDER